MTDIDRCSLYRETLHKTERAVTRNKTITPLIDNTFLFFTGCFFISHRSASSGPGIFAGEQSGNTAWQQQSHQDK
jgi:hypothetical protein